MSEQWECKCQRNPKKGLSALSVMAFILLLFLIGVSVNMWVYKQSMVSVVEMVVRSEENCYQVGVSEDGDDDDVVVRFIRENPTTLEVVEDRNGSHLCFVAAVMDVLSEA